MLKTTEGAEIQAAIMKQALNLKVPPSPAPSSPPLLPDLCLSASSGATCLASSRSAGGCGVRKGVGLQAAKVGG